MQFLRRRLSDGNFLAGGGAGGKPPPSGPAPPLLLVIGPPDTDWVQLFKGKSVHGDAELRVEQAQFAQLSLVASTHGGLSVAIGNRRFRPDFVLVREAPAGPDPGGAPQRLLAGLHMGGVPGSDPLPAAWALRDPRNTFAQLVKLQRELGPEEFPLVPQRFCTRPRGLLAAPTFPMTVTLSPAPSGAGQARVGSPEALGLVAAAMGGNRAGALVTMTPNGTQRVRVTRIGGTDRALSWSLAAGDPTGAGPQLQPMAVSARHRCWLDACARLFGGLDICGVEALRGPDGREHILEVLGSWVPLEGPGAAQDRARIVELVLGRMRAELPPPPQVILGTAPEQRPPPQGAAPLLIGPAQPRPPPQGQPRPSGGVASAAPVRGPAQQPHPQTPPTGGQPRPQTPPTAQPRPQTPPPGGQPRPLAPPTSPQRRSQAPPTTQPRPQTPPAAQPRPQAPPTSPQPRPHTPPTSPQPRPQAPPTGVQPRPPGAATSPQPRPQAPPTAQPRPQAPPTAQPRPQPPPTGVQPRPQAPPTAAQLRPQAPPTAQPRPQAPPTAQPRPQAPPTAQPRPQAPPTAQPQPQAPPTSHQPRPPGPQAPPTSPQPRPPPAQPRPPGAQAPPTTRQPRPQAPPLAPKPALSPKPGGAAPSPAPSLRQSFASLFD
ncbi:synapsin-1 isoform X3 [Patagioenas fasciata]|uniref:synapsin-1 isoform X3 n=1 Tax=Patagioenas fasciata TaxID=372321 RepID=UPI003A98E7E0